MKDNGLIQVSGNQFFSLTEPAREGGAFPCSDRVDVTHNHITMISDPRVPDHGLPCTPNRTNVPEVPVGNLGSGADLGTGIIAFCTSFGHNGKCQSRTPVDLIVISDTGTATVPEPNSLLLMGTGLVGLGTLVRRKFHVLTR